MALPSVLAGPLTVPVVASPMFIYSGPELVAAQCQAGVIGSFPALNARPQSALAEWIEQVRESNEAFAAANPDRYVAPFAVNQIVHRSNDRLEQDLATVVEHEVPIVITSLGAREEVNEAVHSYGGIVLHDVINDRFARKAVENAVWGMLPKNKLAAQQLSKLKVYAGPEHPHGANKPKTFEFNQVAQ